MVAPGLGAWYLELVALEYGLGKVDEVEPCPFERAACSLDHRNGK
jgi:hypothetical protein